MASTFCKEMIVEFSETDMAGIVHFSQFFRYAERTEHAFLRSLDLTVIEVDSDGSDDDGSEPKSNNRTGWPKVHASFDYLLPLRFEDLFTTTLGIERVGQSSIHYRFLIEKMDRICGRGKIVAAYAQVDRVTGRVAGAPLPDGFREKMHVLDTEGLARFLP